MGGAGFWGPWRSIETSQIYYVSFPFSLFFSLLLGLTPHNDYGFRVSKAFSVLGSMDAELVFLGSSPQKKKNINNENKIRPSKIQANPSIHPFHFPSLPFPSLSFFPSLPFSILLFLPNPVSTNITTHNPRVSHPALP